MAELKREPREHFALRSKRSLEAWDNGDYTEWGKQLRDDAIVARRIAEAALGANSSQMGPGTAEILRQIRDERDYRLRIQAPPKPDQKPEDHEDDPIGTAWIKGADGRLIKIPQ